MSCVPEVPAEDSTQLCRLPYIDDHVKEIHASAEQVWHGLLSTLRRFPSVPARLASAWGLEPSTRTGGWSSGVAVGDAITGFAVAEVEPLRLLTLRGTHRFSEYELRFELELSTSGGICLHARSSAAFPHLKGRIYRALVIGSRGHRVGVRRILAHVQRQAEGRL